MLDLGLSLGRTLRLRLGLGPWADATTRLLDWGACQMTTRLRLHSGRIAGLLNDEETAQTGEPPSNAYRQKANRQRKTSKLLLSTKGAQQLRLRTPASGRRLERGTRRYTHRRLRPSAGGDPPRETLEGKDEEPLATEARRESGPAGH